MAVGAVLPAATQSDLRLIYSLSPQITHHLPTSPLCYPFRFGTAFVLGVPSKGWEGRAHRGHCPRPTPWAKAVEVGWELKWSGITRCLGASKSCLVISFNLDRMRRTVITQVWRVSMLGAFRDPGWVGNR